VDGEKWQMQDQSNSNNITLGKNIFPNSVLQNASIILIPNTMKKGKCQLKRRGIQEDF